MDSVVRISEQFLSQTKKLREARGKEEGRGGGRKKKKKNKERFVKISYISYSKGVNLFKWAKLNGNKRKGI